MLERSKFLITSIFPSYSLEFRLVPTIYFRKLFGWCVLYNSPREERYTIENIILLAIIPRPREPKLTANSLLGPLVEELKDLKEYQYP